MFVPNKGDIYTITARVIDTSSFGYKDISKSISLNTNALIESVIDDFEFGVSTITKGGSLTGKVEASINTNDLYTHGVNSKGSLKLEFNNQNPAGAIGINELGARDYKKGDIISYWVYVATAVTPVKGWAGGRINHEGGGLRDAVNNQATFVTSNIKTNEWVNAQVRITADKTEVEDIQLYFDAALAGIGANAYTVYIDDITYIEDSLDKEAGIEDFEFATGDYTKTGEVTLSYNTDSDYVKSGTQSLKAEIPNRASHTITLNNINIPAGAKENGGYISYWVYVDIDESVTEASGWVAGQRLTIAGEWTNTMLNEKISTNDWHNYVIKIPAGNTMELKIQIDNHDYGWGTGSTWVHGSGKEYTLYFDNFEYIPASVNNMIDDFEYDQKNYTSSVTKYGTVARFTAAAGVASDYVKNGNSSLKVSMTAMSDSSYTTNITIGMTAGLNEGDTVSFWVKADTSSTTGTPGRVGGILIGKPHVVNTSGSNVSASEYQIEGIDVTSSRTAGGGDWNNQDWYNYSSFKAGQWYKVTFKVPADAKGIMLSIDNAKSAWNIANSSMEAGWSGAGLAYDIYYDDFTVIRAPSA